MSIVDDAGVFATPRPGRGALGSTHRRQLAAPSQPRADDRRHHHAHHPRPDKATELLHLRPGRGHFSASLYSLAAAKAAAPAADIGGASPNLGFYAARGPALSIAARARLRDSLVHDAPEATLASIRAAARQPGHTGISAWSMHRDQERQSASAPALTLPHSKVRFEHVPMDRGKTAQHHEHARLYHNTTIGRIMVQDLPQPDE